jgi:hypothetical protein
MLRAKKRGRDDSDQMHDLLVKRKHSDETIKEEPVTDSTEIYGKDKHINLFVAAERGIQSSAVANPKKNDGDLISDQLKPALSPWYGKSNMKDSADMFETQATRKARADPMRRHKPKPRTPATSTPTEKDDMSEIDKLRLHRIQRERREEERIRKLLN